MTMTMTFADLEVYEGASIYEATPVVVVALSRNGFPLGDAEFYSDGYNSGTDGILSAAGGDLLSNLLDLGWTTGSVDGVDFKVS